MNRILKKLINRIFWTRAYRKEVLRREKYDALISDEVSNALEKAKERISKRNEKAH